MTKPLDVALDRLLALHPKRIDLSLGRMERLLEKTGNPHLSLPPVIHVAGTNGKGSTIAFLKAFCDAAGLTAHVYTSPHLTRFNERIVVAGQEITDTTLMALIDECEAANAGAPITFFEITTVLAFLAFARTPADVVLLETGLGGRLDATNVVPQPAVTALTAISHDHADFLGDAIAGIAGEKAGIMKPGVPCVVQQQAFEAVLPVLRNRAADVGADVSVQREDWFVEETKQGWTYRDEQGALSLPRPALPGPHQVHNAATAIQSFRVWRRGHDTAEAFTTGLQTATWPARLQTLGQAHPCMAHLPEDWTIMVDGAHNVGAAKMLATYLTQNHSHHPVILITALQSTKDVTGFCNALRAAPVTQVITVPVPNTRASLAPEALATAFRHAGFENVTTAPDHNTALQSLTTRTATGLIMICGSLYLCGEVLSYATAGTTDGSATDGNPEARKCSKGP